MNNHKHWATQQKIIKGFLSRNSSKLNGSDVLVFIPALNEEKTIADVVNNVKRSTNFDVLVIDDGSDDNTPEIIKELDVEVLTHKKGTGWRIISGLQVAYDLGYKYVIKIDGDNQHDPDDVTRLYKHAVKTQSDIVIGSRHYNGFTSNVLSLKGFGMWLSARLVSMVSRQHITDATSGLKLWNRRSCELALKAFENGNLQEGSTHHSEELMIAAREKLNIQEIPVIIHCREYGVSKSYSRQKLILYPFKLLQSTVTALSWKTNGYHPEPSMLLPKTELEPCHLDDVFLHDRSKY
ncbi:MAG: glycosyltransferase family 2 protein [Chloroflexi bacterium]|nr:glycosyltransferase family 2 protein [Chloroflexota bacterium]